MKTFESDFVILHLSDLHIVSHGGDYSTALHKMIDHISMVTNNYEKIVIVVTGDIVEKGEFDKSSEAINAFFTDLKSKIGRKVVDVIFAPGNHDKKRGNLNLPESDKEPDEKFWNDFKTNDWQYFEKQFHAYLHTIKTIREGIFNYSHSFDGTYGLHTIRINEYRICFLCVNSSWSCIGGNESGKLRIGRFQLDDLKNQYQACARDNPYDLTIALMHHPTDWLTQLEQKYFNQYLIDEYRLNANIVLQGHIHEKEIYNWYNQNHSITTFVTGMGWDQQKNLNDSGHRYSIYEINCVSKIARVNTYVSDISGNFNEDTKVYQGNNVMFPLNVHKYLEINRLCFADSEVKYYYPSSNILEDLGAVALQLSDFVCIMHDILNKYKTDYDNYQLFVNDVFSKVKALVLENNNEIHSLATEDIYSKLDVVEIERYYFAYDGIGDFHKTTCEIIERIRNHLILTYDDLNVRKEFDSTNYCRAIDECKNKHIEICKKEKFLSFLGEFCLRMHQKIFKEKTFNTNDTVRFHFRAMESESVLKYRRIFALTLSKDESGKLISIENADLSDIDYHNSLIEQSFIKNKTLLYSLNPSSNNHTKRDCWLDFITIVPNSAFNVRKIEKDDEIIQCPYITFGVTVNSLNFQETIRILAYIGFEKIVDKLFVKFFKAIPYNLEKITSVRGYVD